MEIYNINRINLDYFTQVPNEILCNPNINSCQFRILCFLILCRFQKIEPNSKLISEYLGIKQDTVRRNLRYMSKSEEITKYFNFFFKSNKAINQPDSVIIYHKYDPSTVQNLNINQIKVNDKDLYEIRQYLSKSTYFSKCQPLELFIKAETTNKNELLLGLVYIDSKKNIKNNFAYLSRCFKNGQFIFKKEYKNEFKETGKGFKAKIKDKLIFEVRSEEMNYLIEQTEKDYKFSGVNLSGVFHIVSGTYHTKQANIKNVLDKFHIEYKILKVPETDLINIKFDNYDPFYKSEFLTEIKSFLNDPKQKIKVNL